MKNLKKLRTERNLSQNELGAELGYSQAAIGQYENGLRADNTVSILMNIADYFGVSIDYLLGRTNIREPFTDEDKQLAYRINRLGKQKLTRSALEILEEIEELNSEKNCNE